MKEEEEAGERVSHRALDVAAREGGVGQVQRQTVSNGEGMLKAREWPHAAGRHGHVKPEAAVLQAFVMRS